MEDKGQLELEVLLRNLLIFHINLSDAFLANSTLALAPALTIYLYNLLYVHDTYISIYTFIIATTFFETHYTYTIISRLGQSQGLLYKYLCDSLIS